MKKLTIPLLADMFKTVGNTLSEEGLPFLLAAITENPQSLTGYSLAMVGTVDAEELAVIARLYLIKTTGRDLLEEGGETHGST